MSKFIFHLLQDAFNRIKKYLPKLISILKIKASKNNMEELLTIKKCLAKGFPDQLFISLEDGSYINDIIASPRTLYRNSSLVDSDYKYLVAIPVNFSNQGSTYHRFLSLPTSYTLEDVIECYSTLLTEKRYSVGTGIHRNIYYNDVRLISYDVDMFDL